MTDRPPDQHPDGAITPPPDDIVPGAAPRDLVVPQEASAPPDAPAPDAAADAVPDVDWEPAQDDPDATEGPALAPTLSSAATPDAPPTTLEERREALAVQLLYLTADALAAEVRERGPAELAAVLEEYEVDHQLAVLRALPDATGSAVFDYMEPADQAELLKRFRLSRAKYYINHVSPDVRADIFGELPPELVPHFLALLPRAEQQELRELLAYDEHTAGGRMTTDFAWLSPDETVAAAIDRVRTEFRDVEMLYYLYVLDDADRLLGLVTLRYLMISDPAARIGDIMHAPVVFLHPEEDQEVVARELAIYDFYAMPIVDHGGRMLGIVTFDDVVDVVEDEAVEDQELFGGMAPSEEDYVDQTISQAIKQRFPWLAAFLVLSSGSGFIILAFGERGYNSSKPFFLYVTTLIPMLAAMAGNAATQTATLVIRAIGIGDVDSRNARAVIKRELWLGVTMGLLLAIIAFGRAFITTRDYAWTLATATAGSVVAVMGIATATGAALPMLFKRMGFDPAVMSSPLIATIIDIVTITLYFSIATAVYLWFVLPAAG